MNGVPYTIVGVMPASFDLTRDSEELWVPIAFTPAQKAEHDDHYLTVFGRLKRGATHRAGAGRARRGGRRGCGRRIRRTTAISRSP